MRLHGRPALQFLTAPASSIQRRRTMKITKMSRGVVLALILVALFSKKTQCQEVTPAAVPAPVRLHFILRRRERSLGCGPTL